MTHLLAALLAASAGWWWGHSTARIVVRHIGSTYTQDQAELDAQEQHMTTRHTASTITDDALDDLYARIAAEETLTRRLLAQRQELAAERYTWQERGDKAEATIERVRNLVAGAAHTTSAGISDYSIGRHELARTVLDALDEPAPTATEATHTKEQ